MADKLRLRNQDGSRRSAGTPSLNRRRVAILLGGLLLVIIGLSIGLTYFIQANKQKDQVISELQLDKNELKQELSELDDRQQEIEQELMRKNQELEEKQERVQQLLKRIDYLKGQVQAYIKQGKLTEQELEKYKGKYEQLLYYNRKYQRKIAMLEKENKRLKSQLAQTEGEVDSLQEQNTQLESKIMQQDIQLESAKVLKAIKFNYAAVKRAGKTVEQGELNDRDIRYALRCCFTIAPNEQARKGRRRIYMVLHDPTGEVVHAFSNSQSGHFRVHGEKKIYSAKTEFQFRGGGKEVCIQYKKPDTYRFREGEYTLSLYNQGFMIGQDSFQVS